MSNSTININEDALDAFLGQESKRDQSKTTKRPETGSEKKVMDQREGLIERVDKVFVTKDGKQLLREQY